MATTANFSYQGNAVMYMKSGSSLHSTSLSSDEDIVIEKIDHLVPIEITCTLNGNKLKLNGSVDYSTNTFKLSQDTKSTLHEIGVSESQFKNSLFKFGESKNENALLKSQYDGGFTNDEKNELLQKVREVKASFDAENIQYGKETTVGVK